MGVYKQCVQARLLTLVHPKHEMYPETSWNIDSTSSRCVQWHKLTGGQTLVGEPGGDHFDRWAALRDTFYSLSTLFLGHSFLCWRR